MNALDLTSSIREAKEEINREYDNGNTTESERDFRLTHILGF